MILIDNNNYLYQLWINNCNNNWINFSFFEYQLIFKDHNQHYIILDYDIVHFDIDFHIVVDYINFNIVVDYINFDIVNFHIDLES